MATKRIWHTTDARNPNGAGVSSNPDFCTYALAEAAASASDTIIWMGSTDANGVPNIFTENVYVSKAVNLVTRGSVHRQVGTPVVSFLWMATDFSTLSGRGTWQETSDGALGAYFFGNLVNVEVSGQYFQGSGTSYCSVGFAGTFRRCVFDGKNVSNSTNVGQIQSTARFHNCHFTHHRSAGSRFLSTSVGGALFSDCTFKDNTNGTSFIDNYAMVFVRPFCESTPAFPGLAIVTEDKYVPADGTMDFKNESIYNFYPEAGSGMLSFTGEMGADGTGTNGRGMGASNTGLRGPNALWVHHNRKYRILNGSDAVTSADGLGLGSFTEASAGADTTWSSALDRWEMGDSPSTLTDNSNTNKGQDLGAFAITNYVECFGDETNVSAVSSSSVLDLNAADYPKQIEFGASNGTPTLASVTMGSFFSAVGQYSQVKVTMRSDAL